MLTLTALVIFVSATLAMLINGVDPAGQLSLANLIIIGAIVLTIPLAAYGAVWLVERATVRRCATRTLAPAIFIIGVALVLRAGSADAVLIAFVRLAQPATPGEALALLTTLIGKGIFCMGLSAFVVLAFMAAIELPWRWLSVGWRVPLLVRPEALRIPLIIAALGLSFHLFAGLFAGEISPTAIRLNELTAGSAHVD